VAIDGKKIIHAVMEGSRIRESKGIIPLFGVYLSVFSVHYYNLLSFDFERRLGPDRKEEAASLLVEAAQECGYATFQGIRNSFEWAELVAPMIETREDQIDGFLAVAVAFGWGQLTMTELVPGEKMVIEADETYEATGFLERFGTAQTGKCYMLRGVAGAFMDLLYGQDYPDGCFTFQAEEPYCRAKGDGHCAFVARKKPSD
jgi:hypothetical protein